MAKRDEESIAWASSLKLNLKNINVTKMLSIDY